jgi:glycosyltransferase involved in cell wall biosynthesis
MTLYLAVPCYNEEEALPETARRLKEKIVALISAGKISAESRVLFVDDGSRDDTWALIKRLHDEERLFSGLKLSGNRGHQNALLAGLMAAKAKADAVISLDADLQDDIDAIDEMLAEHAKGAQIVYGVRSSREKDSRFKRGSALAFYRLLAALGVNIVYNHADYRLMSRAALEGLADFREANLFLRGIVPLLGYKTATVEYERGERLAGESKYPLKKMASFALDGITSFSAMPIRFIALLGFLIFLVSIGFTLYTLFVKLFGFTVPGWSTLMASIWILGGLQLLALGIIGEYVGKIYMEVKARPRYIVEETLD